MADLKAIYENLQLSDVNTYIQSGNVIFKSNENLPDTVFANRIEDEIFKKYTFQVSVIIRREDEMREIISENPFLKGKNIDHGKLHVTFLAEIPLKGNIESIETFNFTPDRFIIHKKEVYLYVPNGYGETKLSNTFFEKKLKVKATTRNWKTVTKLYQLASQQTNK